MLIGARTKSSREPKPVKEKDGIAIGAGLKVLRTIVWIFIGILLIRGVVSLISPTAGIEYSKQLEILGTRIDQVEQSYSVNESINGFTEAFVKEYCTYTTGGQAEFKERIRAYVAPRFYKTVTEYDFLNSYESEYINTYRTDYKADHQANVYVNVVMQNRDTGREMSMNLLVPVYMDGFGGYVVEDVPVMVPASQSISDGYTETVELGEKVDINNLEESITNFLRAYYGDSQASLDYFLHSEADSSKFIVQGTDWEFDKVVNLTAYVIDGEQDSAVVAVGYYIRNGEDCYMFQQHTLTVSTDNDGLYIKDLQARTGIDTNHRED